MLYRAAVLLITIVDETVDIGTSNVSFVGEKNLEDDGQVLYAYVSDVIYISFGC